MPDAPSFYPPAPADVPSRLAKPSRGYRVRVVIVLASLLLFALVYLGLTVGSGYACYWLFAQLGEPEHDRSRARILFNRVATGEKSTLTTFNNGLQQWQLKQIDTVAFIGLIEGTVLPEWRNERSRLTGASGLSAEEQRLAAQLDLSLQRQEEAWELMCRAIREDDRELSARADQKARESEQLHRQFSADASRYLSRPPSRRNEAPFWHIVGGIASGLLCLFLVKGFFKRQQRIDPAARVEVTEKDQPILFAFIRRLCQDTRAPFPHRVYLTAEVNAAVFYHESLLSLILPTPKNLVIGLGLVNRLNLSEFKAVLAHEFGHFSQNSMKLGSYVYVANRVIGDLVYGRDWLDDLVNVLRGTDIRIAAFAWAFTGVLWVLRKILQGLFRVINFANAALSRQMEFNADLVAVSVTGSDALVHGLTRLDLAADALAGAWNDLTAAADHQLFSRDLFFHQTRAAEYIRTLRKDPLLGEPPPLPAAPAQASQVFKPEDTSVPKMWATHPSNHDREINAKRRYIRSVIDERSPWLLFHDAPALREHLTRQLYKLFRGSEPDKLDEPEVVQAFIDTEHAETTYAARYHGLYDHRYLTPGALDELIRAEPGALADPARLAEASARLYGDDLKVRMETHQSRHKEYNLLMGLAQGAVELTGKDFEFRGTRYRAAEAGHLRERVQKELDHDFEWMSRLDREVLQVHLEMARQVSRQLRQELEDRYRFHLALQDIHGQLSGHQFQVQATLAGLVGRRELSQAEFHGTLAVLQNAHDALRDKLEAAQQLRLPPLKNFNAGEPLGPFVLSKPLIRPLNTYQNTLEGEWINRFLEQMAEVIDKVQRLHFKSLGGILALQEKIAEEWQASRRASQAPVSGRADSPA